MQVYGITANLLSDTVFAGTWVATFPRSMVVPASQFSLEVGIKGKVITLNNLKDTTVSLPCSAQKHWEYSKRLKQKTENTIGW